MLASTHEAADRIILYYMKRFKYPYRFAQTCDLPDKFQAFCRMSQAFVIGATNTVTMVRCATPMKLPDYDGAQIEGSKNVAGVVPFLPWAPPGMTGAAPRDLTHMLKAIGVGTPIIAEITFVKGLGEALMKCGQFKLAKKEKWPTIEIRVRSKGGNENMRTLEIKMAAKLEELAQIFTAKGLGDGETDVAVYLRSSLTGALMQAHGGTIEWRGPDRPVVIRSECGDMMSVVQPGKAPEVATKLTYAEDFKDQTIPGLYSPKMDKENETKQKTGRSLTTKELDQKEK